METTTMYAENIGVREFESSHAKSILALEKKLNVEHWKLNSPKHNLSDGKIIKRRGATEDKTAEEQGEVTVSD